MRTPPLAPASTEPELHSLAHCQRAFETTRGSRRHLDLRLDEQPLLKQAHAPLMRRILHMEDQLAALLNLGRFGRTELQQTGSLLSHYRSSIAARHALLDTEPANQLLHHWAAWRQITEQKATLSSRPAPLHGGQHRRRCEDAFSDRLCACDRARTSADLAACLAELSGCLTDLQAALAAEQAHA